MSKPLRLLLGLLLAAIGYAFYRQHTQQAHLDACLQRLEQVLADDNDVAEQTANNSLKALLVTVERNRNQPSEVTVLAAAKALDTRADSLVQALRNQSAALRIATANTGLYRLHRHPNEASTVRRLLGSGTPAALALRQQLANYSAAAHHLWLADSARLVLPTFDGSPVVAALATLTQLESEVRANEIYTYRHLTQKLGASQMHGRVVALASAETNMVAPGDTYHAELFLANVLHGTTMRMTCNGQPIRISPAGIGLVRFRASAQPGPAFWTGRVHINQNGRDSTFQVRVPYRVARR